MGIILKLSTYFIIYSFLGWCIESIYKSIIEKKLVNSGFLFGAFCPIYGFGAIIMYLFLEDVSNKPIIIFCLGFVVLSIWEYFVGLFLEKVFHAKYWDYSEYKLNLQGRVCLLNSFFWGLLGVLFIDIINPFITGILEKINVDTIMYFDIIIYIIIFIDIVVSIKNNFSIAEKLKYIEELNNNIKEKLEEIKTKAINTEISESLQDAIDELKTKRDIIVRKSYRSIIRLKKAFPTMKSEQISKFLNNKEWKDIIMVQEIYIIDDDESSIIIFRELFKDDKEYKFISVKTEQIDIALKNIPSLIVINEDAIDRNVIDLCRQIRRDEDNTITPVIVVSSNGEREHRMRILNESIEYFIKKPVDEGYLYLTVKNLNRLLSINRRISPLTGLPGNVQIHAELKKRLSNKEEFSILYLDLDNFKAYNDVYGFVQGDQIIEFTANTITSCIHEFANEHSFIGHIGGDDFIAIVDGTKTEKLCQSIIATFDEKVKDFFTEEDAENGYIEIENRKGIVEQFPLTSISIGVVVADSGRFHNILEIGEIGAQVKHAAKSVMGSSYAVDRRK